MRHSAYTAELDRLVKSFEKMNARIIGYMDSKMGPTVPLEDYAPQWRAWYVEGYSKGKAMLKGK